VAAVLATDRTSLPMAAEARRGRLRASPRAWWMRRRHWAGPGRRCCARIRPGKTDNHIWQLAAGGDRTANRDRAFQEGRVTVPTRDLPSHASTCPRSRPVVAWPTSTRWEGKLTFVDDEPRRRHAHPARVSVRCGGACRVWRSTKIRHHLSRHRRVASAARCPSILGMVICSGRLRC